MRQRSGWTVQGRDSFGRRCHSASVVALAGPARPRAAARHVMISAETLVRVAMLSSVLLSSCTSRETLTEPEASSTEDPGGQTSTSSDTATATSSSAQGSGSDVPTGGEAGGSTSSSSGAVDGASSSTTAAPEPACPYTDWYSCNIAWPCGGEVLCGDNHRFDENGCPREQCDLDADCPSGQVCRDIIACAGKDACIGPLNDCGPFFEQECSCIAGGSCDAEIFYCFPPEEYTCEEGRPPE